MKEEARRPSSMLFSSSGEKGWWDEIYLKENSLPLIDGMEEKHQGNGRHFLMILRF